MLGGGGVNKNIIDGHVRGWKLAENRARDSWTLPIYNIDNSVINSLFFYNNH